MFVVRRPSCVHLVGQYGLEIDCRTIVSPYLVRDCWLTDKDTIFAHGNVPWVVHALDGSVPWQPFTLCKYDGLAMSM